MSFDSNATTNANDILTVPKIPGRRRSVSPSFKHTAVEADLPTKIVINQTHHKCLGVRLLVESIMVLWTINQESQIHYIKELPR